MYILYIYKHTCQTPVASRLIMSATLSSSSSSSSPIVLKRVKNIFGNEYAASTTLLMSPMSPSVILMKRKNYINNNTIINKDVNNINNNTINNIFAARDNNDFADDTRIIETTDTVEVTPDDYYHRHRERKLEYQKNYNRENDDKIKEYNKDYYLKRRAEILEKAKTRVICECGCDVQLSNMNAHKKTKKHLKRAGK